MDETFLKKICKAFDNIENIDILEEIFQKNDCVQTKIDTFFANIEFLHVNEYKDSPKPYKKILKELGSLKNSENLKGLGS